MKYAALFDDVEQSATRNAKQRIAVDGLSDEQNEALCSPFRESAVVCAGAGAGKTKLLTERVCALIDSGVQPERIAVLTFTRKAAQEIQLRVSTRLGTKSVKPFCGTVHSLALTLALKKGVEVKIVTEADELAALAELQPAIPAELAEMTPRELLLLLNREREQSSSEGHYSLLAHAYVEIMQSKGLQDFTSLLSLALKHRSRRFDYVLVDESQDLSYLQYEFIESIAPGAHYWFIGDPDQAIYSFRGSEASMMHLLRSRCAGYHVLSYNYRCAQSIVAHANNVISFNEDRFPIQWKAMRALQGDVAVRRFDTGEDELTHVKHWLMASPGKRMVLARTQALIAELKNLGLPAMSVHESKGLEWPEVHVMGCESGLFPHPLGARNEERRLFYVAMTRARDSLCLSYTLARLNSAGKAGQRLPSAFLFETQALQDKT